MAMIETWLRQNLRQPVVVHRLDGNLFSGDNQGNKIGVIVSDNNETVDLDDSCFGYFIRSDGATIPIEGTASGNTAYVVLPASCYVCIGQFSFVLKVGTTTLAACTGYIYRTSTDTIVDPGSVVPSLSELLDKISDCETATAEAENVNISHTKVGPVITITTTDRDGQTEESTIREPTISVTKHGTEDPVPSREGDFDITVISSNGTEVVTNTVTIPNPNAELSDRAHIGSISRSKTRTGNPIQIEDAVNEIADKTVIKLVPKQDLHGYSKPWVGGAGKNLIDTYVKTEGGIAVTKSGFYTKFSGQATGSPTGIAVHAISSENGKSYIFSAKKISGTCSNASGIRIAWRTYKNGTEVYRSSNVWWSMSSDYVLAIDVTSDCDTLGIYYFFSQGDTATDLTIAPMLRLSTVTDDTWEPYENLCPISGYDTVNAVVNLFDYRKMFSESKSLQASVMTYELAVPNGVYTLSTNVPKASGNYAIFMTLANNSASSSYNGVGPNEPRTLTVENGKLWIHYRVGGSGTIVSKEDFDNGTYWVVLRKGTEAGNIYPIAVSLATNGNQTAGTVYSGTVTLLADGSGQVDVDGAIFTLNGTETWATEGRNDSKYYSTTIGSLNTYKQESVISDSFPYAYIASSTTEVGIRNFDSSGYNNARIGIRLNDVANTTSDTLIAILTAHPVQAFVKLVTPVTYTLTADQIQTLLGYNYIYTDGTEIALTYRQESLATNETLLKLLPTGSASGNPVTFSDGADGVPLKQLTVNVQPNQDLHGYGKPWVAGAGKNMIPLEFDKIKSYNTEGTWDGNVYTYRGITFKVNTDNAGNVLSVTLNGTTNNAWVEFVLVPANVKEWASGSYVMSTGSAVPQYVFLTVLGQSVTNNNTYLNYTLNSANQGRVYIGIGKNGLAISNLTIYPMVCLASAENPTTFAPYTNFCPIRGWDSVPLLRTGKNLLSGNYTWKQEIRDDNGNSSVNSASHYTNAIHHIKPGTSYTISGNLVGTGTSSTIGFRVYFLTAEEQWIQRSAVQTSAPYTFTTPNDCESIQIQVATALTLTDAQLEEASSASSFESYKGKTYDISIPSEAGTVYGCQIVLDENGEGELKVNKKMWNIPQITQDMLITSSTSGSTGLFVRIPTSGTISGETDANAYYAISSIAKSSTHNTRGEAWSVNASGEGYTNIWVPSSSTLADLNEKLNGEQIVSTLKTPVTYTLTADQVKTLLGPNIISSDAGTVSVRYFKVLGEEQDLTPYAPKSNPTFTGAIKIGNTTLTEAKLQALLSLAAGGLNGTTWLFNSSLNAPSQTITIGNASGLFVFGGSSVSDTQYTLAVDEYHDDTRLRYYDNYGDSTVYSTGQWMDQLCRTITFTADIDTATPGVQTFVNWLKANATMQ